MHIFIHLIFFNKYIFHIFMLFHDGDYFWACLECLLLHFVTFILFFSYPTVTFKSVRFLSFSYISLLTSFTLLFTSSYLITTSLNICISFKKYFKRLIMLFVISLNLAEVFGKTSNLFWGNAWEEQLYHGIFSESSFYLVHVLLLGLYLPKDVFIGSFPLLIFKWDQLFVFLNKFIYFIYLFLAVLGLRCCVRAFSSCSERGLLFVAVHELLIAVASHWGARALGMRASVVAARRLSSCGSRALEHRLSSCGAWT